MCHHTKTIKLHRCSVLFHKKRKLKKYSAVRGKCSRIFITKFWKVKHKHEEQNHGWIEHNGEWRDQQGWGFQNSEGVGMWQSGRSVDVKKWSSPLSVDSASTSVSPSPKASSSASSESTSLLCKHEICYVDFKTLHTQYNSVYFLILIY